MAVTLPPTPADVMLEATRTTLRAGRLPPAEVIRRQLDALDGAGYRLEPQLDDGGAELMLTAAKRALLAGHFTPAGVISRQLAAVEAAGHCFVGGVAVNRNGCASFEWGPDSFAGCARCGVSYWKHPGSAGHARGAHRRG